MEETESKSKTINGKRKHINFSQGKKKKKITNELSANDLEDLSAFESTHSNLFKLQMDDLLKEQKQEEKEVSSWINNFSDFIEKLPEGKQTYIKDFSISKNIKIPIFQSPKNEKGYFKFFPPTQVTTIGSYSFGTMCSSNPVIDIAIEIPKTFWQGMDHLNYRYHRKCAFYLTYIAYSLLDTDLASEILFSYKDDCNIKPILFITPKGIEGISFCLTVYPCKEAFKESRFLPDKNNVRAAWFFDDLNAIDEPTTFYNSTVLADILLFRLNNYINENLTSQSIKEAIILLKIWLSQRDLTSGYGRINGFVITSFIVHLLKKKRIFSHMSNYEIFKCAVLELSINSIAKDLFSEFPNFDAFFSVSDETLQMIKHEAKLALTILNNSSLNTFNYLFMKKVAFFQKFEYLMHLKGLKVDLLPKVCEKLKEGLGNRILLLDVQKVSTAWPISSYPPNSDDNIVTIGFLLNPDVPHSNLEKGPLANDPKAKLFQEFWGKQSELRRFQDGSVREAVFWPAETIADKRRVFCTILKDIMERHFNFARDRVIVNGIETECVLEIPDIVLSKDFPPYGIGEEAQIKFMQSFNSLAKQLRILKLPLMIASVQGISPAFRFTEIFPPLSVLHKTTTSNCYVDGKIMKLKNKSVGVPFYTPVSKVIVHFEGSGKWPDDIEALKRVKAAFYIKIAELVKSQCLLIAVAFATHTDIYKDGYIFRLEVACHKEINLLKQFRAADGSIKMKENKQSHDLEVSSEILPKLNGVLHGLHQQNNSFGTACRLAKRWIASQLKNGFIQDITIELLVAFIYLHPEPFTCPLSPQVGFIRFLSLLITHNWAAVPLIVNLNNELKAEDLEEINSNFTSQRATLPPMVVVTPFDKRGNMWTKNMPPALILKRIILLAEASLSTLHTSFLDCKFLDIKTIFRPPLQSFDLMILLKRKEIPKLSYAIDVRINDPLELISPYVSNTKELYPVVDFDPVQKFLNELIVNFGDHAVFLNDPYGGDFIAVKWKSASFKPENAKTRHGCKIILSVEEILESIKILGTGLIKKLELKTENWQLP